MGFQEAVRKCLRDWKTVAGRAPRSEYWWFTLFNIIASIVAYVLLGVLAAVLGGSGVGQIILIILSIAIFIFLIFLMVAGISAIVRRLHDKDKSGWFYWIALIPIVGTIILLVWFCTRGTVGPNTYGDDTLGGDGTAQVFE